MSYTVCIDPGHGKTTPGKRAFDESFFEYEFNRDVSWRLRKILVNQGLNAFLTAPFDEDVSLQTRCDIEDLMGADIFVSIHANAYGSDWNDANGWGVFHHTGSAKGRDLALCVQVESIPYLGLRDRGVKPENFFVLKNTKSPAILIEHGFFTNRNELAILKISEFREKCAVADAKGVMRYFGLEWNEDSYFESGLKNKLNQIRNILEV